MSNILLLTTAVSTIALCTSCRKASSRSLFPMALTGAYESRVEQNTRLPTEPGRLQRNSERVVVYSVPVEIHPGDLIQSSAEMSLHNDEDWTVVVSSKIVLGVSPGDIEGLWGTGGGSDRSPSSTAWITTQNGSNIPIEVRKLSVTKSGILLVPKDLPSGIYYVNLVAHAASIGEAKRNWVNIQAGHGHVNALIFRKIEG